MRVAGLLRALARRGWVIVLTVVGVTVVAVLVSTLEDDSYEATTVMYVPSGAESGEPGNAYEASHLAASYVEVVMNDEQLHRVVGEGTGVTTDDVDDRLSARQLGTTALLEITYSGASTPAEATAALTVATTHLLQGSASIPRGSLVALDIEPNAEQSRRYLGSAGWLGAVLGLFLGCGLAVLLERSDRRIDQAAMVRLLLGVAATDLDKATAATAGIAVTRWAELTNAPRPLRVACVPLPGTTRSTARRAAALIQNLLPDSVSVDPSDTHDEAAAILEPTEVAGRDGTAEQTALSSDATVLVIARGSREVDVLDGVRQLQDVGVKPRWALVLDRARR
ncbi:MAG: Wzz/FepE/Etk N-terminal domain-containing protein [Ilumatobacteraceae bacterium]